MVIHRQYKKNESLESQDSRCADGTSYLKRRNHSILSFSTCVSTNLREGLLEIENRGE